MQATSRSASCMVLGIGLILLFLLPALAACSTGNGTGIVRLPACDWIILIQEKGSGRYVEQGLYSCLQIG